jgi:hypothetical protein
LRIFPQPLWPLRAVFTSSHISSVVIAHCPGGGGFQPHASRFDRMGLQPLKSRQTLYRSTSWRSCVTTRAFRQGMASAVPLTPCVQRAFRRRGPLLSVVTRALERCGNSCSAGFTPAPSVFISPSLIALTFYQSLRSYTCHPEERFSRRRIAPISSCLPTIRHQEPDILSTAKDRSPFPASCFFPRHSLAPQNLTPS